MTNEALNSLLEQGLRGCEDRHIETHKCTHCIYNLPKDGIDYCMFHDME